MKFTEILKKIFTKNIPLKLAAAALAAAAVVLINAL